MMNKRVLRQCAVPSRKPNPKNGLFCAEQVKFVVCTAIKNIDHKRMLVLYIYAKENVLAGDFTPRWTMFQSKNDYITLHHDEKGTCWRQSMLGNLNKDYRFTDKCSFYSKNDEARVIRYCQSKERNGFGSLSDIQYTLFYQRQKVNERKGQQKILERMKPIKSLPRDIKGFMHRETLPHYIFYD